MEQFETDLEEKKVLPKEVKSGNAVVLLSLFTYLCFSFGIGVLQEQFGEKVPWLQSMAVSAISGEIGMILPAVIYLFRKKGNWKEQLGFHKIKISTFFLLILFAYMIMPLMNVLSAVTMLFSKNVIADTLQQMTGTYSSFRSLIIIALIPCLFEEFMYRGFVYGTYAKYNKRFGIFLSGLLFGLVHMNINQFAYAFAMGMIFAMLIEATGSIWSSVIVHFCINGTSVMMQYATQEAAGNEVTADKTVLLMAIAVWAVIAAVTTVIAVLLYYAIAKNEGKVQNVKEIWSGKKGIKLVSMSLVFAIVICIAFMRLLSF